MGDRSGHRGLLVYRLREDGLSRRIGETPGSWQRGLALKSTSEVAELKLPSEPASVARARSFVRGVTAGRSTFITSELELLASELATNAVMHAGTPFIVRVGCSDGTIRLEVEDANSTLPTRKRHGLKSPVGRGLLVVEQVADRWGVRAESSGKVVWAELDDEEANCL
ncbi:MAG TPA: ATP-binding protein [Acidimicrobiia bacterium]|nr:ATP-binding protein [Acidimicrobiia bacterium]